MLTILKVCFQTVPATKSSIINVDVGKINYRLI